MTSVITPVDHAPSELPEHTWRLSGVEFEDGHTLRCFECTACGAVRFD